MPTYQNPILANVCPHCAQRWPMIAGFHIRWMAAKELAKHLISAHGWADVSTRYPGEAVRWFYAKGTLPKSGIEVTIGNCYDLGEYRLPNPGEILADDLCPQ